jgi:hypothetical protein
MTNHWDTELQLIALGKRCASDLIGSDEVPEHMSAETAFIAIEECLRLGRVHKAHAVELERQNYAYANQVANLQATLGDGDC